MPQQGQPSPYDNVPGAVRNPGLVAADAQNGGQPAVQPQQAAAPVENDNPYFKPNAALQAANNVQSQVIKKQNAEQAHIDRRQEQDNVLQAEAMMADEGRQQEDAAMAQQQALAASSGLGPMNPTQGLTGGLGAVPANPQASGGQQGPSPEELAQAIVGGQVSQEELGSFDPAVVAQAQQMLQPAAQ